MKATFIESFSIPTSGGKREPIEGKLIIVPNESDASHPDVEGVVLTRAQYAASLRSWRSRDPFTRRVPRRLVAAALMASLIKRAVKGGGQ